MRYQRGTPVANNPGFADISGFIGIQVLEKGLSITGEAGPRFVGIPGTEVGSRR
jgi:hypothetical protein